MTKSIVSLIGIMIVASVALSGSSVAESESRDPPPTVEIALLNAITGPISQFAPGFTAAAEIAINHINDKQDDYHFSLSEYDSGCDGNMAASAAQDIVDDGIELVAGALCSGASMGANDVLSYNGIPHVSPTSTSPVLSNSSEYSGFLRVVTSDGLFASAVAGTMEYEGYSSPAVIFLDEEGGFFDDMQNIFADEWNIAGNSLCTDSSGYDMVLGYSYGQSDFSDIAEYIVENGCDSVALFNEGADGPFIIGDLENEGFSGGIVGHDGTSYLDPDDFTDPSDADGVLIAKGRSYQESFSDSERGQAFSEDCTNDSDCSDGIYTSQTYDAITLLAEAYMLSEMFDESVEDSLHYVGYEWEGASPYNITFDEDGEVDGGGFDICEYHYSTGNSTLWLDCDYGEWMPPGFDFEPDNELYGYNVFELPDSDGDGFPNEEDSFPDDACAHTDTDGDGLPDTIEEDCQTDLQEDNDDDGDGLSDLLDAFPLDSSEWSDLDGDGIGDNADTDDDDDGVPDSVDAFPNDGSETVDLDGDGIGDNADTDDDGDGINDSSDLFPRNSDEWGDYDGDGIGDNADIDDDGDGVYDQDDSFPMDASESEDLDLDGIGDNSDMDIDGDGWDNPLEYICMTDDRDNDSVPKDTDGDQMCDLIDEDDDGDGTLDNLDSFPLNENESADSDGDGIGDESDDDDDDDGWTDDQEVSCGTDPLSSIDLPADSDDDGECDADDSDDDNDGVSDEWDSFPMDPYETKDTDRDGIGDNADTDDDGDGWLDEHEVICASAGGSGDKDSAAVTPVDLDGDGLCDAADPDDDGDGYPDPGCVKTGQGTASQQEYVDCAVADEDWFPRNGTEWYDGNSDGKGDNAFPPSEGLPGFGLALVLSALAVASVFRRPLRD